MMGVTIPSQQSERHRARADETRLALLRLLEGSSQPLDVQTLAERVGLHVNTVRWHLGILIKAGFVSEGPSPSSGRGRPRRRYSLAAGALDDDPGAFRLLVEVLVDALELGGPSIVGAAEEAGRRKGGTLLDPREKKQAVTARHATGEVLRLLDGYGFQPRLEREPGGQRISMRPCPFGRTAAEHSSVICPAHLGLIRGVLDTLGAPIEATSIEPFAERDVCLVHLVRDRHGPTSS